MQTKLHRVKQFANFEEFSWKPERIGSSGFRFFGSGWLRILLANCPFCKNSCFANKSYQNPIPCANSKYRADRPCDLSLTARVFKNSQIGAVLERLLCKLNCVGSCSIANLSHFRENCNAQGQAVWDFSGPANRVYCSQTFVFAKTAVLPIRATRILHPALIVNIGLTGHVTCRWPPECSKTGKLEQFWSDFCAN